MIVCVFFFHFVCHSRAWIGFAWGFTFTFNRMYHFFKFSAMSKWYHNKSNEKKNEIDLSQQLLSSTSWQFLERDQQRLRVFTRFPDSDRGELKSAASIYEIPFWRTKVDGKTCCDVKHFLFVFKSRFGFRFQTNNVIRIAELFYSTARVSYRNSDFRSDQSANQWSTRLIYPIPHLIIIIYINSSSQTRNTNACAKWTLKSVWSVVCSTI